MGKRSVGELFITKRENVKAVLSYNPPCKCFFLVFYKIRGFTAYKADLSNPPTSSIVHEEM